MAKSQIVPYENATSGMQARDEITKLLRRFGCEAVGFMDDFENHSVTLAFKHRGRPVQLVVTAKGWAGLYLREHPWRAAYSRKTKIAHEQDALRQGDIAINSILRDWVKGQVTAVECGVISFEAVFLPYMLTADGTPLIEKLARMPGMLPAPME
jgi:hypothetical protein